MWIRPRIFHGRGDLSRRRDLITLFERLGNNRESLMIKDIPLFSGLEQAELDAISSHAVTRSFPKNSIIINEGDTTDSLYVILSGKVKVYLSDEQGKEIILNMLGPDEYFGELALLDRSPRSASVMTVEPTRVSIVHKADFDACLTNNPGIALKLIETLAQRMRQLTENVKNLALLDVYGRIARVLLNMATETDDGTLVIQEKLTQQDIAKMVGASREMVSRIMKDLTTGGYIKSEGGHITIFQRLPSHW